MNEIIEEILNRILRNFAQKWSSVARSERECCPAFRFCLVAGQATPKEKTGPPFERPVREGPEVAGESYSAAWTAIGLFGWVVQLA